MLSFFLPLIMTHRNLFVLSNISATFRRKTFIIHTFILYAGHMLPDCNVFFHGVIHKRPFSEQGHHFPCSTLGKQQRLTTGAKKCFRCWRVFLNSQSSKQFPNGAGRAMLRLRVAYFLPLTTRCITNTQLGEKRKIKRATKASHLTSDTAGKTKEDMMTIVLFYRSCSGQFSRKTLARITQHTHAHTQHRRFTVVNGLLHPIATNSMSKFVSWQVSRDTIADTVNCLCLSK